MHELSHNRKFQYGDGFFETMLVQNGEIRFWKDHLERINYACKILKIDTPSNFKDILENEIKEMSIFDSTRIKVQFWRSGEGKYTPESNQIEYHIESTENNIPLYRESNLITLCESSEVIPSKYSSFKCFLLPYITAAIEKKEKKVDDLIILNTQEIVTESISSNLFWVKDNIFYTPSLESGCINGVMRKQLLSYLKNKNIEVYEDLYSINDIRKATSIFTSNITGLTQFRKIDNKELELIDLENLFQFI